MGFEWHIYGPSGHGFELGTHGSCIAYLWAKWAWVWSGNTYMGLE